MGLGIVEPHSGDAPVDVPGTALLLHSNKQKSSKETIVLVPKPSQSPRDPLVGAATKHRNFGFTYASSRIGLYGKKTLPYLQYPFPSRLGEFRIPAFQL